MKVCTDVFSSPERYYSGEEDIMGLAWKHDLGDGQKPASSSHSVGKLWGVTG
ncbi:MAG TPA: hypothetical protein IGS52_07210 [Oscillatoriaceae cyanobacterium M33_DOE_052]|nr:hypothetical protein [Oscillatoriaceae cyanobacterium M33_DOE_052]